MRQFQKTLEDLSSRVASAENLTSTWQPPATASESMEQMQHLQRLRDMMATARALLDDCNEQQIFFTANQVLVPNPCLAKLEDLNTRMKLLDMAMDERQKVLVNVGGDYNGDSRPNIADNINMNVSGSNNASAVGQMPNLGTSVTPPWERATTPANVPYYIE